MTFDEILRDLTVKGIIDGNLNERLYAAHRAEISYLTADNPPKNANRFEDIHDAKEAWKRENCDNHTWCRGCRYFSPDKTAPNCFARWLNDEVFYNWYEQKPKGGKK